jgi:NTE family protein
MITAKHNRTALVVTGGGARAAYEVGVLQALRQLLPSPGPSPFSVYCGVSGGALNAATLALGAADFGGSVDALAGIWSALHVGDIFEADAWRVVLAKGRRLVGEDAPALFDNTPLAGLLARTLDFGRIDDAIDHHGLRALCVTCAGYGSGQSVSFFQGRANLDAWRRPQQVGAHVKLGVEHVLASMSMPLLFPAVKLHREYFGDGNLRQLAPLSPSVHLGADRVLVIGSGRTAIDEGERPPVGGHPSLAQTAGHLLAGIYADGLSADVERMSQVNRLLARMPPEVRQHDKLPWRPIELMTIEPSERLDQMAADLSHALPWSVRMLLPGIDAAGGGALASYLLFEATYTRTLIELGLRDAMARRGEIVDFLAGDLENT